MKSAQRKLKTLGPEQVMYHCCHEMYELAITFPHTSVTITDWEVVVTSSQNEMQKTQNLDSILPSTYQPEVTLVFTSQNSSRYDGRECNVKTPDSKCYTGVIPTLWQL